MLLGVISLGMECLFFAFLFTQRIDSSYWLFGASLAVALIILTRPEYAEPITFIFMSASPLATVIGIFYLLSWVHAISPETADGLVRMVIRFVPWYLLTMWLAYSVPITRRLDTKRAKEHSFIKEIKSTLSKSSQWQLKQQ